MGFEALLLSVRVRPKEQLNSFRIGMHVVTGKAAAERPAIGLVFVIGVERLKEFGMAIGDRVLVMEGTGPDTGTFALRPAEGAQPGAVKITAHTPSAKQAPAAGTFRVGVIHTKTLQHITKPISLEPAVWQKFGGQVFVCVPWAKEPEQ